MDQIERIAAEAPHRANVLTLCSIPAVSSIQTSRVLLTEIVVQVNAKSKEYWAQFDRMHTEPLPTEECVPTTSNIPLRSSVDPLSDGITAGVTGPSALSFSTTHDQPADGYYSKTETRYQRKNNAGKVLDMDCVVGRFSIMSA